MTTNKVNLSEIKHDNQLHAEILRTLDVIGYDRPKDLFDESRRPLDSLVAEAFGQKQNQIADLEAEITRLRDEDRVAREQAEAIMPRGAAMEKLVRENPLLDEEATQFRTDGTT